MRASIRCHVILGFAFRRRSLRELSEIGQDDDQEQANEVHAESDDEGSQMPAGPESDGHKEAVERELEVHHLLISMANQVSGRMQDAAAKNVDPRIEKGEGLGAFESQNAGEAYRKRRNGNADEQRPPHFPAAADFRSPALPAYRRSGR